MRPNTSRILICSERHYLEHKSTTVSWHEPISCRRNHLVSCYGFAAIERQLTPWRRTDGRTSVIAIGEIFREKKLYARVELTRQCELKPWRQSAVNATHSGGRNSRLDPFIRPLAQSTLHRQVNARVNWNQFMSRNNDLGRCLARRHPTMASERGQRGAQRWSKQSTRPIHMSTSAVDATRTSQCQSGYHLSYTFLAKIKLCLSTETWWVNTNMYSAAAGKVRSPVPVWWSPPTLPYSGRKCRWKF